MDEIDSLIHWIEKGNLLDSFTFKLDIDAALDLRDNPVFEEPWLRVSRLFDEVPLLDGWRAKVDELGKAAFKKCFATTQHDELAGCVSDDYSNTASQKSEQAAPQSKVRTVSMKDR